MKITDIKTVEWLASLPEWRAFITEYTFTDRQAQQFAQYLQLLLEWNEMHNLTTITKPSNILQYHFQDSLELMSCIDVGKLSMIADVGSGPGFPGLPLKIAYPHLSVVLIEVNQKKIAFLEEVVDRLGLEDVIIYELDWRTFLRTTQYPIQLFTARASLQPEELLRMFRPGCAYKDAALVYWASKTWKAEGPVAAYIKQEHDYTIKAKKRKLVVMEKP